MAELKPVILMALKVLDKKFYLSDITDVRRLVCFMSSGTPGLRLETESMI